MTTGAAIRNELWDLYVKESAAIEQDFSANGDGRAALSRRTALVDSIVQRLWNEIILGAVRDAHATADAPAKSASTSAGLDGPKNFTLVATGGFGRGWLFPHSDIDLLFLHTGSGTENEFKDPIRRFSQELWDLRLKLSPMTRNLSECERLDPNNVEFAISLLDSRYLAGDRDLFAKLHEKAIPRLIARDYQSLIQNLGEITRARHHKFGNTVFHLEPNVKDGPGGLRDYSVANWLALISAMEKLKVWPDASTLLPVSSRRALEDALDFQMSVRCFLHFRHGRHDNTRAPLTGCVSTSATCAPFIECAISCSRKFRRRGRRCIGNSRDGARKFQATISPWSTGSFFCSSPADCAIPRCCCGSFISWPSTA
jgi:[protein-PII] uridylyltransferase